LNIILTTTKSNKNNNKNSTTTALEDQLTMTTTATGKSSEEEPSPKRVKTTTSTELKEETAAAADGHDDDVAFLSDFIQPEILKRRKEFQVDFCNKQPYPHVILPNLLHEELAQQVQTQVKQHSHVNFKESDLFRVYQSIDLANLQPENDEDDNNTQDDAKKTMKEKQDVDADNDDDRNKIANNIIDARKIPAILKLRRLLYSSEWRHFVERLMGLPVNTLTEQVDCAFNCHAPGCHLLCHDDVIGTRKVSYILYLTDPSVSSPWTAADGGALELYGPATASSVATESDDNGMIVPATIPSKVYLPLWNHMAFFVVEPGVSFHAVQEVLGDRPRLSLQGWYHYHRRDDGEDVGDANDEGKKKRQRPLATLEQLKQASGRGGHKDGDDTPYLGESSEGPFVPIVYPETDESENVAPVATATVTAVEDEDDNSRELSLEDGNYLSKFLNPTYLTPQAMRDIRRRFEEDSSVQLRNFLTQTYIQEIDAARRAQENQEAAANQGLIMSMHDNPTDLIKYYQQGTTTSSSSSSQGEGWKLVGPSHKQRYLEYHDSSTTKDSSTTTTTTATMGEIMHELRRDLLEHYTFHRFLACLTNLSPPIAQRGRIRRFRKGLDYTVAHYGLLMDKPILDATLCFVEGKGMAAVAAGVENHAADVAVDNIKVDDSDDDEPHEADVIWESGDCGGFECYIEAEDEENGEGNGQSKTNNEAFAEYKAAGDDEDEDDTKLLSVSASNNTLSLVYRDPGTMRFIKYVGSRAPSSRWDVAMEYLGEDDHDEDNGNDEDE
jgi:prolyl 3-hydroxylase /prolyl 3,4-dihydroxylase